MLRQKKLEVAMEEEGLADEEVMLAVITVTVVNNTVLCAWQLQRVDLKCSHYRKREVMWGDGYINLTAIYIYESNHHIIYLKLTQCYILFLFF